MLREIGLFEAIMDKYGYLGLALIYQRGQVPMDGIFLSGSLSIIQGDYFLIAHV